jgi:hypothetical protein
LPIILHNIALAWCITQHNGQIPKHLGEVSDRILPKEISLGKFEGEIS